jgi:hypothetical protein
MGGGPLIIPLVALAIPMLFLLGAIVFDAVLVSWLAYRLWHDRGRPRRRPVIRRAGRRIS